MERSQIIEYIRHPEQIGAADLSVLEQLTHTYPYCQTFQLLQAKCLHDQDSPRYGAQLKLAAAYAGNRGLLKQLIEKTIPFTTNIQEKEVIFEAAVPEAAVIDNTIGMVQSPVTEDKVPEMQKPPLQISPEVVQRMKLIDIIRSRMAEIPAEPEPEIIKTADAGPYDQEPVKAGNATHSLSEDKSAPTVKPSDSNAALIDRFIREEPRLSPPRREFFNPVDMAKLSSIDKEDLVSETLARIFVQQGDIPKAIKIYERLCLNFPEKSSYFVAQIENLRGSLK